MHYLTHFLQFWYDFIVGDDWTVAVGVVLTLILSALMVRSGLDAWWLLPLAVLLLLCLSLWRGTHQSH